MAVQTFVGQLVYNISGKLPERRSSSNHVFWVWCANYVAHAPADQPIELLAKRKILFFVRSQLY